MDIPLPGAFSVSAAEAAYTIKSLIFGFGMCSIQQLRATGPRVIAYPPPPPPGFEGFGFGLYGLGFMFYIIELGILKKGPGQGMTLYGGL